MDALRHDFKKLQDGIKKYAAENKVAVEKTIEAAVRRLETLMLGFFGEKGKEIINSDSNGVTGKNSLPIPKETLNLQGSSGSVMKSDEQKFEERISGSLKHFNSQPDGNNDQDPTLNLNSSIRDGCLEKESFGIQDVIGINSFDKNIEVLKGMLLGPRLVKICGNKKVVPLAKNVLIKVEDMEVYEEEK
ncbi:hypothetical protein GH714_030313 [Hevea brasiliensis]|uniref:Uncharacterized protein n=1 Tax=Hevea brasiliensis TaxID=3981 RepID=A0A6A6NAW3_HEVBR|nr:hypothetical protein GH714_030313 [Hevea brasiliensis]